MHQTDITPTIVYVRRSTDNGKTWSKATAVLNDPKNRTLFSGAAVVDPKSGAIHYVHQEMLFRSASDGCSGCHLHITSSYDDGLSWSAPKPIVTHGADNRTWGGALASGIALTHGQHAGRLLIALRHDCGCGTLRASFAIFSDDGGATWTGGDEMVLMPKYGGGWTECEVAELRNGSVLMTSRNFYGVRSSVAGVPLQSPNHALT